jgi:hypothetical protein
VSALQDSTDNGLNYQPPSFGNGSIFLARDRALVNSDISVPYRATPRGWFRTWFYF